MGKQNDVSGYPTLMFGTAGNLETYEQGRDFDSMSGFVDVELAPKCSPQKLHVCSSEERAEVLKLQLLPAEELAERIAEKEAEVKQAEDEFTAGVAALDVRFEKLEKDRQRTKELVKLAGLS